MARRKDGRRSGDNVTSGRAVLEAAANAENEQAENRPSKNKLGLPDLEQAKTAVLVSLRSPEAQRSYRHAIDEFVLWCCSKPRLSFNKTVVTRYRVYMEDRKLAPGTVNVKLAAVRELAYEVTDSPTLADSVDVHKCARQSIVALTFRGGTGAVSADITW